MKFIGASHESVIQLFKHVVYLGICLAGIFRERIVIGSFPKFIEYFTAWILLQFGIKRRHLMQFRVMVTMYSFNNGQYLIQVLYYLFVHAVPYSFNL